MGSTPLPIDGPESPDDEDETDSEQTDVTEFTHDDGDTVNDASPPVGGGAGGGAGAGSSPLVDPVPDDGDDPPDDDPSDDQQESDDDESTPTPTPPPEAPEAPEDSNDDDEEEDQTVTLSMLVDPLSYAAFDMQPVVKRVIESFRGDVELEYVPVPTRDLPKVEPTPRNGMPLADGIWSELPETTEQVNRAWVAAMRQGSGDDYLRDLWERVFAAGTPPTEETLLNIAQELALDMERFCDDMDDVDLPSGSETEPPITKVDIDVPAAKTGYVRYVEFVPLLATKGLLEKPPRSMKKFVAEHEPVASAEIVEVYGYDTLHEAEAALEESEGVKREIIGEASFWVSK